ncbi:class I SAM-dependent methyltransferase [Aliagarivorans taiwanensis]|uniref:class I SAM-dependent methyltransferase n=1 Tax=Aliagarivorans taiwanensis TaxID=561966 RepID=UPI000420E193|nr:class I SAM-dependent methyltransferase [Aliagarivorans taiwanensis]
MNYFTAITSRREFFKALELSAGMEREFLYDCGSTATTVNDYSTSKFKPANLPLSERISRIAGVYTNEPISLYFELPDADPQAPFFSQHYYHWLTNNKGTLATGHRIKDHKNYLASLGFVDGKDKLHPEQVSVLRHIHSFFWDCKRANKDTTTPTPVAVEPTSKTPTQDTMIQELAMMIPDGERLRLPATKLHHYPQIKSLLEKAGGKYGKNAFTFTGKDAADIKSALLRGEELNDKKAFQFFATPAMLVQKAINKLQLSAEESWLEPSAGQGALANAARAISLNGTVVELMADNAKSLREQHYTPIEADFMALGGEELGTFDKIIANPPFTRGQDCDHIKKMFQVHLKPGGRLVAFASQSWMTGTTRKYLAFRQWLKDQGACVEEIEAGAFKTSGTNVQTVLITIDKADPADLPLAM